MTEVKTEDSAMVVMTTATQPQLNLNKKNRKRVQYRFHCKKCAPYTVHSLPNDERPMSGQLFSQDVCPKTNGM